MKKRILTIFLSIFVLLVSMSFLSCEEENKLTIKPVRTIGTYSGYKVEEVVFQRDGSNYNEVVVRYTCR